MTPGDRPALIIAAVAGIAAVAVGGLYLADWFGSLTELNEAGERVSPSGAITGRTGLVIVELLIALATSAGAAVILAAAPASSGPALLLALARVALTLIAVAGHWDRAWYYILEDAGPKVVLLLGAVQAGALVWAGVAAERAARGRQAVS